MIARELWSEYRFALGESGARGAIVSGTSDQRAALTALAGIGIVEGSSHPVDGGLICKPIQWDKRGPETFHASAVYEKLAGGIAIGALGTPPEWGGGFADMVETSETDAMGNQIINACGDMIDPPAHRTKRIFVLRVFRREALYEPRKAAAFIGTINAAEVQVPRVGPFAGGSVQKGCMLCQAYEPTTRLTHLDKAAPVYYEFWIAGQPFRKRVPNIGYNGWYQVDDVETEIKPARFCFEKDGKADPVAFPVRLKKNGTPLAKNILCGNLETPVAAPSNMAPKPLEWEGDDTKGWTMLYAEYPEQNFSGLDLF